MLHNDIHTYRQPMVTSLGIILGFLLNFLANWATSDDGQTAVQTTEDWVVALTLIGTVVLMLYVLYRILNNRFDESHAGLYYQHTFRLYMVAVCMSFVGLAAALFV